MRLFISILLSTVCLSCFAQISFGVKAGANFNEITEIDNWFGRDPKSHVGFHIGAVSSLPLVKKKVSLIAEIQFSRRGDKVGNVSYNLNYLDLPVMLSYSIQKISFQSGVSLGYLLSASSPDVSSNQYLESLFDKNLDFGIVAGAQYQITERIGITGRYYVGLSPVVDMELRDEMNVPLGTLTAHNRTAQIGVVYKLSKIGD